VADIWDDLPLPDELPDEPEGETDPLADIFASLGIPMDGGPVDLGSLVQRLQQAMGAMSGVVGSASGVDWAQAKQLTRQEVAGTGKDPSVGFMEQRRAADAFRLAELWLDEAVALPEVELAPAAWSRAEWVEHSFPAWRRIAEPIVTSIADAMAGMMRQDSYDGYGDTPPEFASMQAMFTPMVRGAAGSMYAGHLARAIAGLATEVVSGNDLGLPLIDPPQAVLLPTNVAAFSDGLGLDAEDVQIYLALREAARQRLFGAVPWLGPQMMALVEHYAREIVIDVSALHDAMDLGDLSSLTPQRLAEASERLQGRLFSPTRTPEQEEILGRMETLFALVEGWIDVVVAAAAEPWMPSATVLAEAVRRRRATGGPTEKILDSLVGLDLRPRRLRDAANLWRALLNGRGIEGRDAVWGHPDMVPTAADLDDPLGFVAGDTGGDTSADDLDAELRRLLDEYGEAG
jgi:putative hydrolase